MSFSSIPAQTPQFYHLNYSILQGTEEQIPSLPLSAAWVEETQNHVVNLTTKKTTQEGNALTSLVKRTEGRFNQFSSYGSCLEQPANQMQSGGSDVFARLQTSSQHALEASKEAFQQRSQTEENCRKIKNDIASSSLPTITSFSERFSGKSTNGASELEKRKFALARCLDVEDPFLSLCIGPLSQGLKPEEKTELMKDVYKAPKTTVIDTLGNKWHHSSQQEILERIPVLGEEQQDAAGFKNIAKGVAAVANYIGEGVQGVACEFGTNVQRHAQTICNKNPIIQKKCQMIREMPSNVAESIIGLNEVIASTGHNVEGDVSACIPKNEDNSNTCKMVLKLPKDMATP